MLTRRLIPIIGIANAHDESSPILSQHELELIRAKVAGGTLDELDMRALLDHADRLAASYESLVQRHAQEADRAQALVSEKDAEIIALRGRFRAVCERLAKWHNHNSSKPCSCEFCEELRTEHHDGYDIVNAAPIAETR